MATYADLLNGLVTALRFDEGAGAKAWDTTAHGCDATLDGITWTANGLEFDGGTDKAVLANLHLLDLPNNRITIFARIYPHTTGGGGTGRIFNWRNTEFDTGSGLIFFTDGTASLGAQTINASNAALANQRGSANQITLNAWNNVFCEYDDASGGTRGTHIYVGTTEISYGTNTTTSTSPGTSSSYPVTVGNHNGTTRGFDGEMAVLYVWNRILSADEKSFVNSDPDWLENYSGAVTYKVGIITDIHHGDANGATQANTSALDFVDDFVARQNATFTPDAVLILGDLTINSDDSTDATTFHNAVLSALDALNCQNRLLVGGNHDFDDLTPATVRTLWSGAGYPYETSLLYGSTGSAVKLIGMDSNYDSGTSGYPHMSEHNGAAFVAIIPDGTNGSDNQRSWLQGVLDGTPSIVAVHHDLAAHDLTGNTYFETHPTWVQISNRATIRGDIEADGGAFVVFNGHEHWCRTKVINDIPYVCVPSLVETSMRPDSSDKGQWMEMSIYDGGFAVAQMITDDTTDGIQVPRQIIFFAPEISTGVMGEIFRSGIFGGAIVR